MPASIAAEPAASGPAHAAEPHTEQSPVLVSPAGPAAATAAAARPDPVAPDGRVTPPGSPPTRFHLKASRTPETGAVHATPEPGDPVAASSARRPLALSPSRASDFKTCPLLYRYRAVDRLPEPPSAPAVRGTLVHSVLEQMFTRPAEERTPELTAAQVDPLWEQLAVEYPDVLQLLPAEELPAWLASAQDLVRAYFTLEDPRRFDPEACELAVEVEVIGSVPLRGFIDRVDLASTGELRVVDYKTGRSPGPDFESRALYQLKFYALMIYRLRGVVPAQLKLIYLADGLSLQYAPTETELLSFEKGVVALWAAMTRALETGDFPASPSSMCGFCAHQAICPAYGGTPPPYPGYPGREPHPDEQEPVGGSSEPASGTTPPTVPVGSTDEPGFTEAAVKVPVDL